VLLNNKANRHFVDTRGFLLKKTHVKRQVCLWTINLIFFFHTVSFAHDQKLLLRNAYELKSLNMADRPEREREEGAHWTQGIHACIRVDNHLIHKE